MLIGYYNMKKSYLLIPMLFVLMSCHSREALEEGLMGSWEYVETKTGQRGCIEYQENQKMREHMSFNPDLPTRHFVGIWHPLRGLRVQHHLGWARDKEGNELPMDKVTGWRRTLFNISSLKSDTHKMHSSSGAIFEARRVDNCSAFLS